MSSIQLLQFTEEDKKRILEEHNITIEEFQKRVEIIKEWWSKNENFPNFEGFENFIDVALLNCKISLEKTKNVVEGFLNLKLIFYDELFSKLQFNEHLERCSSLIKCASMPKLLPNLNRLHVTRFTDCTEEVESAYDYYYGNLTITILRLLNDFYLSNEIIIDLSYYSSKVLFKHTPNIIQTLINIMTTLKIRVNHFHIIQSNSNTLEKLMVVMKTILPVKLFAKVLIHNSLEDLYKYVPQEYLPCDYGGTEKSLEELHVMWMDEIRKNQSDLGKFAEFKSKSVLKKGNNFNNMGMGVDGSFRQLSID